MKDVTKAAKEETAKGKGKKEDTSKYRIPYDSPALTRKQVSRFIHSAKTPAEKVIWRDMLNGPEFNKPKTRRGKDKDLEQAEAA